MVAASLVGRYPQPGFMNPLLLRDDPLAVRLVLELRLPRIIAAALLGSSLAAAGVVMQMLFANPLVEPGLVGVSQGAAFGAALAIILVGHNPAAIQGSAALCALGALALTYQIARRLRFGGWILRLVLSGIAVSALFSAGVGAIKYLADPLEDLPEITFWMLGGLWNVSWQEVFRIAPAAILGITIAFLRRYRLNLLSLQDRVAFSLGARPDRERLALLIAATVAAASVISIAGIVGWVGLIVPHSARRLFRADALVALPAAILLGAIFVVVADTLCRTLVAGEIPLGIVTSLVGASAFIVLLLTHNIRMER
ncbi:iron complex transport system permease protein [Alkalispirochaeta americana]|uniref:Iron complex transport system permease protein n=1 Tax=Alkalispirochaeta americana TaxID=159291 RepID=A0A1N6TN28_9SPIO|nr:iron ABC transporter permease [Alkalispirochaeta americana]SIQ54486.1 iron complex transport system permease protein [Alkalispirochaeta americana]